MKKQIIANIGSNYLLSFVGMTLGFLLVPFLVRRLGTDAYGLTVLAESTVAFFEILTISVRMALSRHAAFSLSKGALDDFIEYLSTGRVVLYFSASIVFVLGVALSANFTHLFRVPEGYAADSRMLFFLVSLGFTISIPNIIFWSALYAHQRFDLINLSTSMGLVMRSACLFFYYSFAPAEWRTLTAYGIIYLVMTFTQNAMIHYWHQRLMPEGRSISRRFFRRGRVREILSFSFHTSLIRGSVLLYQETAHIIINVFWGAAYNALYSVALKLPNMMRRVFIEPSWALASTFTDLLARGDKGRMERLLYLYSKMLSIVTFPLCSLLILLSAPIIRLWVGPDFGVAADVMPYFTAPLFTSIPFALAGCITNAYGKVRWPSFLSIAVGLLNVLLCLVFGVVFDWKLYGVAWAAWICMTLNTPVFHVAYACRISGFSAWKYWLESFIKPLALSTLVIWGGFWVLDLLRFERLMDPALFLPTTALCLVCYGASYALLMNAEEKALTVDLIKKGLTKIGGLLPRSDLT